MNHTLKAWRFRFSHNLVTVAAITGIFTVFFLSSCSTGEEKTIKAEPVRPVKTMAVSAAEIISGLTLPGRVRASRRVELAFMEVGGRLIELPIEGREGQEVKEGELLARIDPTDFQTNLRNVNGRLKETQAALKLARIEYDRVKRIQQRDPGAVSAADIDRKREAVNATEGRIRSLKAEVEDAENKLSYTYLKAPFTGLIAMRLVDNFQDVRRKQPILALEDISKVEILIDMPENVMAVARSKGDDAITSVVKFPTAPKKQFPLELKEYATRADSATQTYQVVLQMPQPEDLNVISGMTGTVTLSLETEETSEQLTRIPAIAVVAKPEGSSYVWVVDTTDMTVHQRDVKVGAIEGSEDIQILQGLKDGEKIVVAGVLKLQEGMQVRLWEEQ